MWCLHLSFLQVRITFKNMDSYASIINITFEQLQLSYQSGPLLPAPTRKLHPMLRLTTNSTGLYAHQVSLERPKPCDWTVSLTPSNRFNRKSCLNQKSLQRSSRVKYQVLTPESEVFERSQIEGMQGKISCMRYFCNHTTTWP